MPPNAVMMMTGTVASARFTASSRSRPSTLFMRRSATTTSNSSRPSSSSARTPLSATCVSKPPRRRSLAMVSAMSTTSSTISARNPWLATRHLAVRGPAHGHGGPLAGSAVQADLAGVVADDAGDDRQPQPRPLAALLRREERVEDGVQVLGRDAVAAIGDLELHLSVRQPMGPAGHHAVGFGGVAGVQQQIDDDLLQLIGIGGQQGKVVIQSDMKLEIFALEFPLQQLAGGAAGGGHRHRPRGDGLPAREIEQLADGRRDAVDVLDDDTQIVGARASRQEK